MFLSCVSCRPFRTPVSAHKFPTYRDKSTPARGNLSRTDSLRRFLVAVPVPIDFATMRKKMYANGYQ